MERRALLVGIATSAVSTPAWGQMVLTGDGPRPRPPDDPAAARFVRAQEFAAGLYRYVGGDVGDFLYHAGSVSHLGLTASLFTRGLDDAGCRDRLGLDGAQQLALVNHVVPVCQENRTGDGPRPRPPDDPAAARFVRAQEFAAGLYRYVGGDVGDFLYHAGIVSHLGLTAYLFNRGLDDAWCRDRLGLDVAKTLAFANHLGLGCDCNRMAELAALLGP